MRFDDKTIERLLRSEWWNLSDAEMHKLAKHIQSPEEFLNALEK